MNDIDGLDLPQKVRLLTGASFWTTHPEPAIGLRAMVLSDGPSGVRGTRWDEREPSLNLPSATALGATWDPDLAYRYGAALAAEARRKGVDVVLGPTINLHRSPLGGRHFEAFSEDPMLTGALAAAYVRGLQDNGVGATPKHYVANDAETDRFTVSNELDDRTLHELYLAPFRDAVEAGAWAIMSAYNSVNGTTMTEHDLLDSPLCTEWGFDGLVISDWTAVRSTEPSARARQDLVMPGPEGPWGKALIDAVQAGRVPESAIDEKVRRLLRLATRVGALNNATPTPVPPPAPDFARSTAAAGMVLLSNTGELPWSTAIPRTIALIGEHAVRPRTQGGGSATVLPANVISPLAGLQAALPDTEIRHHPGVTVQEGLVPLPVETLHATYQAEDNTVLHAEDRHSAHLVWLQTLPPGTARITLTASYHPTESGTIRLGVGCIGKLTLKANGRTIAEADHDPAGVDLGAALFDPPVAAAPIPVQAGEPIDITVDYQLPDFASAARTAAIVLGTETQPSNDIEGAADLARAAEVAVVVVGTSPQVESEGFDRTTLRLPGAQDDLVRAVAAANPRTVVVVNSGSPVTMPWRHEVAALLLTWFGGQEIGNALADVLLGHAEPGGRLPTTWPAEESDVPVLATTPTNGKLRYAEGIHIGYRAWLKAGRQPAYPFGHGLTYTTWHLSDLTVADDTITVTAHNTGTRPGKQVIQAYLSREDSKVDRPTRWLAGFATVHAEPGKSTEARIPLSPKAFAHWANGWQLEPGRYTLHIGTSSADLPFTTEINR